MIKFVDTNQELVNLVGDAGYEASCDDYFYQAAQDSNAVLMTASNPDWTFGGGIDVHFCKHFPTFTSFKQESGGGNERIGRICFVQTVDENIRASKELVEAALTFAVQNTKPHETLFVHGAGTGIGGLSYDDFLEALDKSLGHHAHHP